MLLFMFLFVVSHLTSCAKGGVGFFRFLSRRFKQLAIDLCVCVRECVMVICQTAIFSYHFTSLWSICVCVLSRLRAALLFSLKPAHPFLVTPLHIIVK